MGARKNKRQATDSRTILVSACLAGINCTYRGKNKLKPRIKRLVENGGALPVCPEILGGAHVPRQMCEILGGDGGGVLDGVARVVTHSGADVSRLLVKGARETLKLVRKHNIRSAILKSKSPSCGYGLIYDGTFKRNLIAGNGVTSELLSRSGIKIRTERP